MPEDRSPPEEARSENTSSGKHKWRGKLFSVERKFGRSAGDLESTEDDVASFLQSATPRPKAENQPAKSAHPINNDAAPRPPAATRNSETATTVDVYRRPKPRQNKGLRVKFETAAPKIIGVGGEEAEQPSILISKSLRDVPSYRQSKTKDFLRDSTQDQPEVEPRPLPASVDKPSFQPAPLQRKATGFSEIIGGNISDVEGHRQDTNALSCPVTPVKGKALPQPAHKIHDDTGYIPTKGSQGAYQDLSPRNNKQFDGDANLQVGKRGHGFTGSITFSSPDMLAINSVTPSPSPQPPPEYREAQSSYEFPPAAPFAQITRLPIETKHPDRALAAKETPAVSDSKIYSLRNIAKGLGDNSLDEFDSQVRRFNDIFRLGISAHINTMDLSFARWISMSVWWFLMGRAGLESEVRSSRDLSPALKQAYVNLAKAWWIVKEVTPNHPEVTKYGKASMNSLSAMIKSFGNHPLAELMEVHLNIVAHMRALTMSMSRNEKLPPPDLEIRGLNLHVLLQLPPLSPVIAKLMVNNSAEPHAKGMHYLAEPFFPVLIGDTERHFSFARMFVEVGSLSLGKGMENMHMPCVLTVLRERSKWGVEVAIASQDRQINLVVSDDNSDGLTWRGIEWKIASHQMIVRISNDFETYVKFSEKDFKTLWGICDYTQKIRKGFSPGKDEELVFERNLKNFECDDVARFPSHSIANCVLRIFEKRSVISDSSGPRRGHSGYRLAVITPPSLKTLSSVNFNLGSGYPILFGMHRGNGGSRVVLRILPSSTRLFPTFHEGEDLDLFRHILSGTSTKKEDLCFPSLSLQSLAIDTIMAYQNSSISRANDLRWSQLRVINSRPPHGHERMHTVSSEHLRILADCESGTLTDWVNLASGELQLSLNVVNSNEIKLLRQPQSDMVWSLSDARVLTEQVARVCDTMRKMLVYPTVRAYHFRSISDLHSFQFMITGFSVPYDGVVSTLTISRQRMVVPISKRWEASPVRLQVIEQDKTVQLVAFFNDFSHGSCMNFVLKGTDTFETFSKTGLFYLRIVDAKFALPKGPEDPSREFVCIDEPEYPGEHDDVTIGFENEQGMVFGAYSHSLLTSLQTEIDLEKRYRLR